MSLSILFDQREHTIVTPFNEKGIAIHLVWRCTVSSYTSRYCTLSVLMPLNVDNTVGAPILIIYELGPNEPLVLLKGGGDFIRHRYAILCHNRFVDLKSLTQWSLKVSRKPSHNLEFVPIIDSHLDHCLS